MKLKGINPLEQHVEKLVVAIVGLVFLGVVAMQFVGGGNTVQVGSQDVPLDAAYERIAGQAQAKVAQLNQDLVDDRVPGEIDDLSGRIASSWSAARDGDLTIPVPPTLPPRPLDPGSESAVAENGLFRVAPVTAPAPTGVLASMYAAAVDPVVVENLPALRDVAPAAQPYDMRSVTIAGEFSAATLLESLRADPPGDVTAIPSSWWQGRVEILDVVVERQEALGGGEFGSSVIVSAMPGRYSLRSGLDSVREASELQGMVQAARVNAREIIQPLYYNTILGERWTPPSEEGDNRSEQIDRLLRDLRAVRAEIAKIEAQVRAEVDAEAFEEFLKHVVARQPGRGGGGGQSSSRDRDASQAALEQQREEQLQERLNSRLSSYRDRESEIVASLTALDFDVEKGTAPDPLLELMALPSRLIDGDTLRIWAHDLEVAPGASYRYRMRVVVNNPLFGFEEQIAEEQRDAASAPTVASGWSDWSAPVTVDRSEYWFATRAAPGGEQAIGRTSASCLTEIYTFYYGYWRRAEQRLQAGDEVIASIDLSGLQLPLFAMRVDGGDGATAAMEGVEYVSAPIVADAGSVILDVRAAMPSSRNAEYEVVVREADGRLTVRQAGRELASALRSRLETNYLRGESAELGTPGAGPAAPVERVNQAPAAAEEEGRGGGRGG